MQQKKLLQSLKKTLPPEIFEDFINSPIEEISIPGTSAKLFKANSIILIYLKHHGLLIPSFKTLYQYAPLFLTIFTPQEINGKIIVSPNLDQATEIGKIIVIRSNNSIFAVGKVVKHNKKKAIEIIYQKNDAIDHFIELNFESRTDNEEKEEKSEESNQPMLENFKSNDLEIEIEEINKKNEIVDKIKDSIIFEKSNDLAKIDFDETNEKNKIEETNQIELKESEIDSARKNLEREIIIESKSSDEIGTNIDGEIGEKILTPEETLYKHSVKVLKRFVKPNLLPLEPSAFLSILISNRGNLTVSVKSTAYKTVSKFLEFLHSKKILVFKVHPNFKRKMITSIDYEHPDIMYSKCSSSDSESSDYLEEASEFPEINKIAQNIEVLYSLPIELCEIMYKLNLLYDYECLYTKFEINSIINQYFRIFTDSHRKSTVVLDYTLAKAFNLPQGSIEKQYIFNLLDQMITKKYLVTDSECPTKYKIKKNIPLIQIFEVKQSVRKFNSVKTFGIITGFKFFEISYKDLCEKIEKLGINSFLNASEDSIKFRGKVTSRVLSIFKDEYRVPSNFIQFRSES